MMRLRQLFHFPILLMAFTSCAQEDSTTLVPEIQRHSYKLGSTEIVIRKITFGTATNWFFIQLHDDETTADTAVTAFLQQHGGTLVSIENNSQRYIRFSHNGKKRQFDPNRIFSTKGIHDNLQLFKSYSVAASKAISGFRYFLLTFVPDTGLVIAVHNNTEGLYSINSYKTDRTLKLSAAAVHINPMQDSDDFFITTDHGLFKKLAGQHYNCVLQKENAVNDDGSLSFYYGRQKRGYVNVEAQIGHLAEQQQMLQVLKEVSPDLKKKSK
jgi:hypothetical protein